MSHERSTAAAPTDRPAAARLHPLLEHVHEADARRVPESLTVAAIRIDSAEVGPGDLFVALRGSRRDGHDFVADAVRRGAAAVMVEAPPTGAADVPVVRVPDTRRALAELAAAWHGQPSRGMTAVGITGTVGKTSVLSLLERIMTGAGAAIGTVGSLGVHLRGTTLSRTGFTAPDPLLLHEKLAELRDRGCEILAMEATSHAFVQRRLHGIRFAAGVFTNLLPLEHRDYHGSFAEYVEAKLRFFDLMEPGAPVVYNADDRAVDTVVRDRDVLPIGTGTTDEALIRIEDFTMTAAGTRLLLRPRGPIPRIGGGTRDAEDLELTLRLLGRSNVYNCALAASMALVLGVPGDAIAEALRQVPPATRRMEIVHDGAFQIIDDTVGHPDSINAVFEAVQALRPRRIHIAFAIRGARGAEINRHTAQALAIWARATPVSTLAVTWSEEAADERNTVTEEERDAFVAPLQADGIPHSEHRHLGEAVGRAVDAAEAGDLVLLLGAQGMDAGAGIARARVGG